MGSASNTYIWAMRSCFVLLSLVILSAHLMPLETTPRRWNFPDLMLALCFAWVVRRPETVPVLLIGSLFLIADLIMQRPPGLWTALVVIASEVLRARQTDLRDVVFAFEWLNVALAIICVFVVYPIVLSVISPYPVPAFLLFQQMILTVAAYPLVAGASQFMFGVRRAASGEVDDQGRRL